MRGKVCGLTRFDDARLAMDCGAWALGFIFAPESSRYIAPETAAQIISQLSGEALRVGVFVNAGIDRIRKSVDASGINAIQLHGEESAAELKQLRKAFPRFVLIKAARPAPGEIPREVMDSYAPLAEEADFLLIDSNVPGMRGGTGKLSNWSFAEEAHKKFGKVILSGGLNAENISEALESVNPYAVDASSGLEGVPGIPGIKNPEKIVSFFKELRRHP